MTVVRRSLASLTALAFACVGALAVGASPASGATAPATPGYWLAGADGGVFSFGAPFYGSGTGTTSTPGACAYSPQFPSALSGTLGCDAFASTPSGNGYWLLNQFRSATAFGQAGPALQSGCTSQNGAKGIWIALASSPSGNGFLVTSSNGGVMGCGDAVPLGGPVTENLNQPVVGIATTPDGKGYWLVAADGGIFTYGDAAFYGSMGAVHLNAPVVGIAATPDGKGYWLVAADGGIFSFGDAAFYGSMGAVPLNQPVVGIAATPDGKGYWLVAADGGVFTFGDAPFEGSMAGKTLAGAIVGIAPYAPPAPG